MLWRVEKGSVDPFKYFEEKTGAPATQIKIGEGVKINLPPGVAVLREGGGAVQPGHIILYP